MPIAQCCNATVPKKAAVEEKTGNCDSFFQAFCGVLSRIVILCALQTSCDPAILLQRGSAILDCEAAALPGRFLPELGRSSERPFFFAGLLRPECVAQSLMGTKPTSLLRSCSGHKIPRENQTHVAPRAWPRTKISGAKNYSSNAAGYFVAVWSEDKAAIWG